MCKCVCTEALCVCSSFSYEYMNHMYSQLRGSLLSRVMPTVIDTIDVHSTPSVPYGFPIAITIK